MTRMLALRVLGCHVDVGCRDAEAWALLEANDASRQGPPGRAALRHTIGRCPDSAAFLMARERHVAWVADDSGELLFRFEHELTAALQRRRRDLYFVHAAVLDVSGQAVMLVGASGGGKSTTAWALLQHGCRYLSNEVGPVDPTTLAVYPYPRALGVKAVPPGPYPLPAQTLATGRSFHIPTAALPSGVGTGPEPLTAMFFVRYGPGAAGPHLRPMRAAEAAAHLLAHALNLLAHPAAGLDGAIALTTLMACFALETADLPATCGMILTALRGRG